MAKAIAAAYARRVHRILTQICRTELKDRRITGFEWIADRMIGGVYEGAFRIPIGFSFVDVERALPKLQAACGAEVELVNRQGVVVVRVLSRRLETMISFEEKYLAEAPNGSVLVGFNHMRRPVYYNFHPHPHMMLGGETGMGKTDLIRMFILSLLYPRNPVEIFIVDMKSMSFMPFSNVPEITIARDINGADELIKDTVDLIRERSTSLWANRRRKKFQTKRYLFVDEGAELSPYMYKTRDEKRFAGQIEARLSSIARLGRECGVHLIYSTQYPTAQIVSNQIKVNCGARLAFYVSNQTNSEVLLDRPGAEQLNAIQGRAIFKNTKYMTLQVPYVGGDDEWELLLDPYRGVEVVSVGGTVGGPETPPDGDDKAVVEIVHEEVPAAGEASVRKVEGTGTGEDGRIAADARHAESVAAVADRTQGDGSDEYDVSFGEPEKTTLSAGG